MSDVTTLPANELEKTPLPSAAKSDASGARNEGFGPDLQSVIAAWPALSEVDICHILAIIAVAQLPDDDFDESVRIAEQQHKEHQPDVIVGSSRGGAVAVNMDSGDARLILLCPAWKNDGNGTADKAKAGTVILHSKDDATVPYTNSEELAQNSELDRGALIQIGTDHRLVDDKSLRVLFEVILSPQTEVNTGLTAYYSSLAQAALHQYDTITHLLGRTRDWTAPGTACEVLIRELVRRVLPDRYSVDKGFTHGRRIVGADTKHSPEIDVMIHDRESYAPLTRIDDFVIVQPASVRGVIQVKRTLTSDTLKKGIKNLVDAKTHIRECMGNSPRSHPLDEVFSAFVTFRDDVDEPKDGISQTYENRIKESFTEFKDGYVAPHFVGSLSRRVFGFWGLNIRQMDYVAYECEHPEADGRSQVNLGIQIFLLLLTKAILPVGMRPPFAFPPDFKGVTHFNVFKKDDDDGE